VLGYPNREASLDAIEIMIANGATALELGLPFSDPMADGPIIENASKRVVESGFTISDAINLIEQVRERHQEIPIVVMTYFNPAMVRGLETFMRDLSNAGVDGITFVDLPPEEGGFVFTQAKQHGLAPVMLVSPLTSEERLQLILKHAEGYLYLVSRAGITGLSETFDKKLKSILTNLREKTDLPIVIGFGISKPVHVHNMLDLGADGVVVGSKIIEILRDASVQDVGDFVQNLSQAAHLPKTCELTPISHG
jgi:tryptophan synthase alpha chain